MSDQVTVVERTGCLGNIGNSIITAFIGLLIAIVAFPVLWINEGRVNLGKVAQKSVVLDTASIQSSLDGKLVAATGLLETPDTLNDQPYLAGGTYLQLRRVVEMYAWDEDQETRTEKEIGGGSRKVTRYTYKRVWTDSPSDSSKFREPSGHSNPAMALKSETQTADEVTLGAYSIDPQSLTFPDPTKLNLTSLEGDLPNNWQVEGVYLVSNRGGLTDPQIGTLRVSYEAVESPLDVTLFGVPQGNRLTAWTGKGGPFYRAFNSDRATAIQTLQTEYTTTLWLLRLLGFGMLWIGLGMCFSPLNAIMNILPLAGSISGFLVFAAMFVVALILSVITILVSIIAHNIFLLILVLALIGAGVYFWRQRRGLRFAR